MRRGQGAASPLRSASVWRTVLGVKLEGRRPLYTQLAKHRLGGRTAESSVRNRNSQFSDKSSANSSYVVISAPGVPIRARRPSWRNRRRDASLTTESQRSGCDCLESGPAALHRAAGARTRILESRSRIPENRWARVVPAPSWADALRRRVQRFGKYPMASQRVRSVFALVAWCSTGSASTPRRARVDRHRGSPPSGR